MGKKRYLLGHGLPAEIQQGQVGSHHDGIKVTWDKIARYEAQISECGLEPLTELWQKQKQRNGLMWDSNQQTAKCSATRRQV